MKINTRCSGETHRDDLSTHPDGLMPRKGEIISVWKRGACLLSPAPQGEQLEGDAQHSLPACVSVCVCVCAGARGTRATLGSITRPAAKARCSHPLAQTSPSLSISPSAPWATAHHPAGDPTTRDFAFGRGEPKPLTCWPVLWTSWLFCFEWGLPGKAQFGRADPTKRPPGVFLLKGQPSRPGNARHRLPCRRLQSIWVMPGTAPPRVI